MACSHKGTLISTGLERISENVSQYTYHCTACDQTWTEPYVLGPAADFRRKVATTEHAPRAFRVWRRRK